MAASEKKKRIIRESGEALVKQNEAMVKQLEELHKQEQIELHNRIAAVIGELKPNAENVLLAFELLKHEIMDTMVDRMAESKKTTKPLEA